MSDIWDVFPEESFEKLTDLIRAGQWIDAVPYALVVLAWLWKTAFSPPLGTGEVGFSYQFEKVNQLYQSLGGQSEYEAAGELGVEVWKLLLLQTARLLAEYLEERGGIEWLLQLLRSRLLEI